MEKSFTCRKKLISLILLLLVTVIVFYVSCQHKVRQFYVADLKTIYYDPLLGCDIHASFNIKNDFSVENVRLEVAQKSCSCVAVTLSSNNIAFGATSQVDIVFRSDSSIVTRNEQVILKTSSKKAPIIQLTTKAATVPFLRVETPDKVVPKLAHGEQHISNIKAFAYVRTMSDV
ncbi:MAG: DUF1573 domain-containing protein, partial [Thermoguttaceae bacterium]